MSTSTMTRAVLGVVAVCVVLHASSGSAAAQWADCSVDYCEEESSSWGGDYEWDDVGPSISTELALAIPAIPLGIATTVMTFGQIGSRSANDGVARKGWVVAGLIVGLADILYGVIASGYGISNEMHGITALGLGAIAFGGLSVGLAVTNPSSTSVRTDTRVRADGATLTLSSRF